ncbi:putative cytochrome P450 [Septoria linicola]|nr:putative cytochrome P450 [Septoria linicola]
MKVTVYLGPQGNNFVLNGKHKDLNAEEVYGPLTIPVFGKGVVYDVDNARFMDQRRLVKEGFATANLRAYVPQFVRNQAFQAEAGICDISTVVSEIALYCAAGSLQGKEVRKAFDGTFATLFRHLDDGFAPVNFMLPGLPLPINRRRDHAQLAMQKLYIDIIHKRRSSPRPDDEHDMLWSLMDANYKDGTPINDEIVANLMMALLMGGQHNTAASGTWMVLELAYKPHIIDELYKELKSRGLVGEDPQALHYEDLSKLELHNAVIKETLRLHSPIHSIMRKVKSPMQVPGTEMVVPEGHVLLAAPSFPSRLEEYFPKAGVWDPYRWTSCVAQIHDDFGDKGDTVDYGYGSVSRKAALSPYLPFGAGRHRCVGETFAYAQLTAILATLVRLLSWEQVDPEADVPKTDYSSMFSRPMHPSTIRWRKR